jgi:predicted ATPase with chaperone activity
MPRDVSLAYHGMLFLDELPEFRRNVLEVLRQPLEESVIYVEFRGRPGCQCSCHLRGTAADLKGLRRSPVAIQHY